MCFTHKFHETSNRHNQNAKKPNSSSQRTGDKVRDVSDIFSTRGKYITLVCQVYSQCSFGVCLPVTVRTRMLSHQDKMAKDISHHPQSHYTNIGWFTKPCANLPVGRLTGLRKKSTFDIILTTPGFDPRSPSRLVDALTAPQRRWYDCNV